MNPLLTFSRVYACAFCRHNVTCQRSPKWYFIGLWWRLCELYPTSRLCGLLMGSLNSQSVRSFPEVESRTPLRSLCCPRGIVIESCTDAVFPSVKWTPTRGRLGKLRTLRCLLTCGTVRWSHPSQSANWGTEICAKRKSPSPCLLTIPSFDRIAGLYNRHLNSNRGICLR